MALKKRSATSSYRGEAGRAKAEEELAKQKARAEARKEQGHQPFRFRVAVGGTTEFVILDDAPDFFRHEHNLKNPQTGYWDTFTGCVKEFDNCPVCEVAGRESYYALYLSVLDFTQFKTKDGTEHEFSRKLLVVKPAQQKKFIRAYAKAEKEGRTLRGAVFEVTRDGDKDSSIGNDIEFVEYMEEDDLITYVRNWKDKDGKRQTEDCSVPFDYEALFEEPDADKLRALVGGEPTPGSRAHERKALGGSRRGRAVDDEDEEDDGEAKPRSSRGRSGGYEAPEKTERMRGRASSRATEPDDEEEDDDAPPARGRAAPARRGRSTDDADAEEPRSTGRSGRASGRGRDVEDDAPPARGRATRRTAEPEDDEDDDAAPPGAGRRLPMRGRR